MLAAKRYRGGMTVKQFVIPQRDLCWKIPRMNRGMTVRDGITVCGGMTARGGMTVKQFVIPLRVSGIYAGRYRE
ncbi:hypothetical protein H9I48_03835 [Wolbachia pipientis]|uniref:hypothetical protein n=1 Tax=Wolbachia pipientis TaxID=955 RepID=UPI001650E2C1|nr:hypothetical protein [Wolbachia pipientis]MBC6686351.1 hypothetical protein [Wolbachia pipientis]